MSLVRRRRLDVFAVVAILVGCISIYAGLTIGDAESDTHMRTGRLVLALAQLPVVQFIGEPVCRIIRGQWRRAIGWFIASIVVSMGLAMLVLGFHAASPDLALQPMERYSTEGWYLIGLWGAYITGVMMLVVAVGWPLVDIARSQLFRRQQTAVT